MCDHDEQRCPFGADVPGTVVGEREADDVVDGEHDEYGDVDDVEEHPVVVDQGVAFEFEEKDRQGPDREDHERDLGLRSPGLVRCAWPADVGGASITPIRIASVVSLGT